METNTAVKQNKNATALGQCPVSQDVLPEGKLVKFVFSAIKADKISVAGTFNNWTPGVLNLKKDMVGIWRTAVHLKPGIYEYRYNVDGKWVTDPSARNTVLNEFGTKNTVIEVK